jgi:glycosyltransferase involved in cell wall biosynthesis
MGDTLQEAELTERESRATLKGVTSWPRITIVTAVRNGARYLEDTIRSVISQGYPNLEYIVVDGVSTDGTLEIIRKYEKDITWWVSQPDKGTYDALNTGFSRSTGEIMGWLNASDMLHTKGLFVVGSVFRDLPQVEWITGRPTWFSQEGMNMNVGVQDLPRWSRYRFLAGANKYIQQESTFWRRSLWNRAGGSLSSSYQAAGDFDVWARFFQHARLYSTDALIGGYRFHEDALSAADRESYDRGCEAVIERELAGLPGARATKLFRKITRFVKPIPKVRGLWSLLAVRGLYRLPGPDLPPLIQYQTNKWVLRDK